MHDKYSYRVTRSEEDQEYVGLCAEFPSLSWLSKTQTKAFSGIMKLVQDVIEDMLAAGESIPEPIATRSYSGKFIIRIPPELHRRLAIEAEESHISLNRPVNAKLASGVS